MRYLLAIIFISILTAGFSQQQFIQRGKITYERKLGQFTLMESMQQGEENMFWEEMKKVMPRIVTDSYVLDFNPQSSVYKLEKENTDNKYIMSNLRPMDDAYTVQDFTAQMLTMKTDVFEKKYLIKDSLTKYQWKITGEVRQIAGFDCKKAITKIADSVVVVAFYADEILVKGGPESFNGLPGMIMGIAIPRLSLTLFATKIELNNAGVPLNIPTEKKPNYVRRKDVQAEIAGGMKRWGKEGSIVQWLVAL
jgi:GLPGLI family protein